MSLIIGVKSCQRDKDLGFHDIIRETWGRDAKAAGTEVRFFLAADDKRYKHEPDEVTLSCDDSYEELPFKTRAICQWFYGKRISHMFLCDNDTLVRVPKLLSLEYQAADYAGHFCQGEDTKTQLNYTDKFGTYPAIYPWASGGSGYFLSRAAAGIVAYSYPKIWAEDMYVGQILGPEKITKRHLADLNRGVSPDSATEHFKKTGKYQVFTPDLLLRGYRENSFRNIYLELQ